MSDSRFLPHKAEWWRGKAELRGDTIVVEQPWELYDPFSYYYLQESATRETVSLPYRFLEVDAADPAQVLEFCKTFGVLGYQGADPSKPLGPSGMKRRTENPDGVRLLYASIPDIKKPPKKWTEQDLIDATGGQGFEAFPEPSNLENAKQMTLQEFTTHQALLRNVLQFPQVAEETRKRTLAANARGRFAGVMGAYLRQARAEAVWDADLRAWTTFWNVRTLLAAIYLMVLFDLQSWGRIISCKRCGKMRSAPNPKMVYCSERCQNAAKQARFQYRKRLGRQRDREKRRAS